jgi:hypothetical protein
VAKALKAEDSQRFVLDSIYFARGGSEVLIVFPLPQTSCLQPLTAEDPASNPPAERLCFQHPVPSIQRIVAQKNL